MKCTVPARNVFIEDVQALHRLAPVEIEELGHLWVLYQHGIPHAVVCWSSGNAGASQSWLKRHSFKRCGVDECGVRQPCRTHLCRFCSARPTAERKRTCGAQACMSAHLAEARAGGRVKEGGASTKN